MENQKYLIFYLACFIILYLFARYTKMIENTESEESESFENVEMLNYFMEGLIQLEE